MATRSAAKPPVKAAAKSPAAPAPKAPAKVAKPAAKTKAPALPAAAAPSPVAKVAAKASPAAAAAKPAKPAKVEKPKKPKLVRDSFTIPKQEYAAIDALKQRAAKAGTPAKKSELLRAGLKALAAMNDAAFLAAVQAVPTLKTGRPAKD